MFRSVGAVTRWLGISAGVLSIVMLIKRALGAGFVAPLQAMLDYYHQTTTLIFSWLEPYIHVALLQMHVDLRVGAHWRDAFILFWLYVMAVSRPAIEQRAVFRILFRLSWGAVAAFMTAVAYGCIDIASQENTVLAVAIPVAGFTLFTLGNSIWSAAFLRPIGHDSRWRQLQTNLRETTIPLALLSLGLIAAAIGFRAFSIPLPIGNDSLVFLGCFVFGIALLRLREGRTWANYYTYKHKGDWWKTYWSAGATRTGLAILATMAGVVIFIAANAGLMFAGL